GALRWTERDRQATHSHTHKHTHTHTLPHTHALTRTCSHTQQNREQQAQENETNGTTTLFMSYLNEIPDIHPWRSQHTHTHTLFLVFDHLTPFDLTLASSV